MKKMISLTIAVLLVFCMPFANASVEMCQHKNCEVLRTWQDIEPGVDGHEFVTYSDYYCYTAQTIVYSHLVKSHLEGHKFDYSGQTHDDHLECDVVVYICRTCKYEAKRYVPCTGFPCTEVYWSIIDEDVTE